MQNNRRHNCRHIDLLWAIHFTMALCGGFLGSYALFSRQLVFGSAQTANLMELVSAICGRNLPEVLIRLGALALYGWGAALSVILTRKTPLNIRYASILMTGMAVFASAFIPTAVNPVIALYPVFFVTAFQWCAFTGADGFASSTIFSTNNVKQTVLGFTEYCLEKDPERRAFQGRKARFFGGTLLFFHTGVALEYLALQVFSLRAVWLCFLPLTAGFLLVSADEGRKRAEAEAVQTKAKDTGAGTRGRITTSFSD